MISKTMLTATMLAAVLVAGSASAQGDGYLRSTDNVARIQFGKSTSKEVLDLLGKPVSMSRNTRRGWDQWEYRVFAYGERSTLWISLSDDGVVREVLQLMNRRPGTS